MGGVEKWGVGEGERGRWGREARAAKGFLQRCLKQAVGSRLKKKGGGFRSEKPEPRTIHNEQRRGGAPGKREVLNGSWIGEVVVREGGRRAGRGGERVRLGAVLAMLPRGALPKPPPSLKNQKSVANYGTSGTMVGSYCSFGVKLRKSALGSEVFVKAQNTESEDDPDK